MLRELYHSRLVPHSAREMRNRRRARKGLLASIPSPPITFSEKVRHKMATDRRPILVTFADRVAVRDYVRQKVGSEVLTKLYAVEDYPDALVRSALPREFVLKVSHGSGGLIVVGDHIPPETRLPEPPVGWARFEVSPDTLTWDRLVGLCREWLSLRYEPYEEWAYSLVRPRVLVEELLRSVGKSPLDHKFLVFGGTVGLIEVHQDRFGDHRQSLYTPNWEYLKVAEEGFPLGPERQKPARLDDMIAVAEQLAGDIDFVRVDLYEVGDRIVFGEMTNYPESGRARFDPPEFDEQLGALWPEIDGTP